MMTAIFMWLNAQHASDYNDAKLIHKMQCYTFSLLMEHQCISACWVMKA